MQGEQEPVEAAKDCGGAGESGFANHCRDQGNAKQVTNTKTNTETKRNTKTTAKTNTNTNTNTKKRIKTKTKALPRPGQCKTIEDDVIEEVDDNAEGGIKEKEEERDVGNAIENLIKTKVCRPRQKHLCVAWGRPG